MQILKRILVLREARNWTEYRLSEEAGISQSTISSWYRKNMLPSITSLEKICGAFGITLAQFFTNGEIAVELTKSQQEMLDKWNLLNPSQQRAIIQLLDSFFD